MDDVPSEEGAFNHVAVFPDCPVMWSVDRELFEPNSSRNRSDSFSRESTPACPPNSNVVQYHYHYYSFSGFVSSLVTVGAVCSSVIFLLLVWVGLVQVRSTLGSAAAVEDEQAYSGLSNPEAICDSQSKSAYLI